MVNVRSLVAFISTALILAPSRAFSPSIRPAKTVSLKIPKIQSITPSSTTPTPKSASSTSTSLNGVQLVQYAGQAISLFNNMKTPASIIAGAIVPLGFLAPIQLKSEPGDSETEKRLRKLYYLLSVMTLATELIAVMWATVATNGLTERAIAPAESVWHLLKRDFELEWAAVNTHFVVGMLGFLGMIASRAYFMAGKGLLGRSVMGIGLSGLALMVSIVNRGVAAGGGPQAVTGATMRYGGNVLALGKSYMILLLRRALCWKTFGPIEIMSVTVFTLSVATALKAVWNNTEEKEEEESE